MSYQSPILQVIPAIVSSADHDRLQACNLFTLDQASKTLLFEELVQTYDSHPYFLVRLAEMIAAYRSGSMAMDLLRQTQSRLLELGVVDDLLNAIIKTSGHEVDQKVAEDLAASEKRPYYQIWKTTRQHIFPTSLPHCPPGHQEVKDQWAALTSSGSSFSREYLRKLIIETNHLESTFLLTEGSAQDIIRHGILEGNIQCCEESSLYDVSKIKNILNDALAAYDLLLPLVDDPGKLDRATLCSIHKRLMRSSRIMGDTYISAGVSRSLTRKTVLVTGAYSIQCCPFDQVDGELDIICNLAKQWAKSWRNPFATTSWIHLTLVRCHPFEDGNGRLARLIASIPLMRNGYPPISIAFSQRADYYDAINKAYTGSHTALIQCILNGMRETMAAVQSLRETQ